MSPLKEVQKTKRLTVRKGRDGRPYTPCVLFDLDGTLYDSSEYSERLESEITRIVSQILNLNETTTASLLLTRRKEIGTLTRTIESLGIDRGLFYQMLADRVDPRQYIPPDLTVPKILGLLKEEGFVVGLVSNSGRPLVDKILEALDVEARHFDTIVTSTDAEPKHSPEPFSVGNEANWMRKPPYVVCWRS